MPKPKALFVLPENSYNRIYGGDERSAIESRIELVAPRQDPDVAKSNPAALAEVEAIFTGWGCPRIDSEFLLHAPKLDIVFYGAGSIKNLHTPSFWERGVRVTSAYGANAIPVIEFTLAQILLSLKHGFQLALSVKRDRNYSSKHVPPGAYGSTIGLVSLGMIGRGVCERLKSFDLNVIAYDPFATEEDAQALGIELVDLETVFARADVVSLHTPWLKETEKMIAKPLFLSMKPGATFINTARGAVVHEAEMAEALAERPDLFALLDVTYPEPARPDSPLWTLENVIITPHIAGSQGAECHRMAKFMLDELDRYLAGQPLQWEITQKKAAVMA